MEKRRKIQILSIVSLVLAIVGMSIGFAAFSVTLNISSSASVTPNSDSFSVKFSKEKDSLVVDDVLPSSKTEGITAGNGVIDNNYNPMITNLSANFTSPGQYVEYTIYARNEGEYTAYLNNINFIGNKICVGELGTSNDMVQSACDDINITAIIGENTYSETSPISNHPLAIGAGEEIKVRLEYSENGTYVDGNVSIVFPDIALVYSTIDDSTILPAVSDKKVRVVNGDLDTPGSVVAIGNEYFYTLGTEGENVKLLSMYNLYVGGEIEKVNYFENDGSWSSAHLGDWVSYGDETTGMQDSSMLGCRYTETVDLCKGTTQFSDTRPSDYSGSVIEGYVNNYKNLLESNFGVEIVEARLIDYNEMIDPNLIACMEAGDCLTKFPWLFSTSFWTDIDRNGDKSYRLTIKPSGLVYTAVYNSRFVFSEGIRPVIIISKSEF